MHKRLGIWVVFAMVLALVPMTVVPADACTTTLAAGDDIQAAIDAESSGGVICLAAGLYSPSARIDINKSLTLQGPQADVDPRPSSDTTRNPANLASEAIIDGGGTLVNIIRVAADDVTINGVVVRNGTGDLIESQSAQPIKHRTTVEYTIVHDSSGDEGIQLRLIADGLLQYNHVFATAGDGINLCCGSTGVVIQFNEVHDIDSGDAAIYIYDSVNTTIANNLVYNVTSNDGIKLGDSGDDELAGGTIRHNTVYNTYQDGITIYMSDTVVDGNDVSASTSENGAIYVGEPVDNVQIVGNAVHDNLAVGILVGRGGDFPTNVMVNDNCIENNTDGLIFNYSGVGPFLNATDNWWGASDGPSGAGSGSGDTVSANVDFDPFLTQSPMCGPPPPEPEPVGPPTNKDECKKGGWRQFDNPTFRNQGDCVSFVQSNGRK